MEILPPPGLEHVVAYQSLRQASPPVFESILCDSGVGLEAALTYDSLLAHENAELIRANAQLRARMSLMRENIALAQVNALLEKQLPASTSRSEIKHTESILERSGRKQRRHQFMQRIINKKEMAPEHCGVIASLDTPSDTETTCSTSFNSDDQVSVDADLGTSAMMWNIPPEYTREEVLKLIDHHGFHGSYDFFYLPTDFETELSRGYAYINFTTTDSFDKFREHFSGFVDWMVPSDRVCNVSTNDKHNNLDDHIECFRNMSVMHKSVPERFKPVLFKNGQLLSLPTPTKKINAPRCRRSRLLERQ